MVCPSCQYMQHLACSNLPCRRCQVQMVRWGGVQACPGQPGSRHQRAERSSMPPGPFICTAAIVLAHVMVYNRA